MEARTRRRMVVTTCKASELIIGDEILVKAFPSQGIAVGTVIGTWWTANIYGASIQIEYCLKEGSNYVMFMNPDTECPVLELDCEGR